MTVDCAACHIAMKNNDKKTTPIEHDAALQRVMISLLAYHTELFNQSRINPSCRKWLGDTNTSLNCKQAVQSAWGDLL